MAEELEEIWTNYDRQTVTNYVETRLHHYLFTKIFKDEAEIMSKIIEINALELRAFKIEHFLSIAETQDLIGNFNKLEEMLEGKDVTTSPYCEILGVIKYMFENIKNDDSGSIKNKNFDADKLDEINADILENKKAISSILKSDLFADIQTPDIIDVNLLEVAAKNTDEIYNLARVYEVYDELFVFPTKLELYNAIVDVILKAMSNDKLFELYVLLNTLEALEKTKGKITFQKAGVRELAEYYFQVEENSMEHTTVMQIFFHDLPEELDAKFKPILKYPYICLRMKNSVKARNITRTSYLLLEIERITDNQIKYKCKATEDIRNILVVWDHRLFNDEKSHIKVLDYKTLQMGLNKSFGNIFKYPNIENVDAILEYIPYFEDPESQFMIVENGKRYYDDDADFFKDDLYQENIYRTFDNLKDWEETGWRYINNHELIKRLDLLTIMKLIYLIMQKEHARPGFMATLMDDGTILTILKRLEEIRNVNKSEITELYSPYKKLKCCPIHDPDFYAQQEQEMDDLLSRKADEVDK
ncbi:MAG: DUF6508 domain-containing protein [Methanosphaera sp.]|uniref:DUF6508 domain-containing protein n=1 Tax=Methanosphaera sp. TaxID=2666342 RepID=UPI0025DF7B2B|nr:DUF6508 domain-containing protein [Methanosphaera sp.]MCI5867821.1 DUF6508 domain-containing protein [Methanosphaera sp.]MDD6534831.1 DUF6508 domain-containing protein [Methanosphaera sp.]MDY3955291.1 DUF6508 domain-containing protein [Methanosphaera sp.]